MRGFSVGAALVLASLVVFLGFALASTSVGHLTLMTRTSREAEARDLARSTIASAMEHLYRDREWGAPTGTDPIKTIFNQTRDTRVALTFDPQQATLLGVPASINNFADPASQPGPLGLTVPPRGVVLVARATAGGVTRDVSVVLHMPPFPYAAASDGPIVSPTGLVVGSQQPGAAAGQLGPADLLANVNSAGAIDLGPSSMIWGDLITAGQVRLNAATVKGQLRENQAPRQLPRIQLSDYDPQASGKPFRGLTNTPGTFTGPYRGPGPVTIAGDVTLDEALIFVDGDLTITGSLDGQGIVVTTGQLEVRGQANLAGSGLIAVLCGKTFKLQGQGPTSSTMRGLVYCEQGFEAQQVTLVGNLIASQAPNAPAPPTVSLTDTRLLRDPTLRTFKFTIQPPPAPAGTDPSAQMMMVYDPGPPATSKWVTGVYPPALAPGQELHYVTVTDLGLGAYEISGLPQPPGSGAYGPSSSMFNVSSRGGASQALIDLEGAYGIPPGVTEGLIANGLSFSGGTTSGGTPAPAASPGPPQEIEIDPSQLVPTFDAIRVLYWND